MFDKKDQTLHLIEPTLTKLSGHEYSYVNSLISANKHFSFKIHLWLGNAVNNKQIVGKLLHLNKHPLKIIKYFIRPIRQIQKIFLYYKLLKNKQVFYVCTAGLIDLLICNYLNKIFNLKYSGKKSFFHFHQFNKTSKKIEMLKKLGEDSKKNFKILTTNNNLTKLFSDAGFRHAKTINCPSFAPKVPTDQINCSFNKILYAGVARQDKGFSLVVDTVIDLQRSHPNLPFVLQVVPPKSDRFDKITASSIQKLQKVVNVNHKIKLYRNGLTMQQYQELFFGAICLLVYEQNYYADKFSGVALDAFYAGSPIVTVANTWMGDLVLQFEAGIVLEKTTIDNIKNAILEIIKNYDYYHNNAKKAASYLIKSHDPKNTLQIVYDYL